jgi:hypothetical protein
MVGEIGKKRKAKKRKLAPGRPGLKPADRRSRLVAFRLQPRELRELVKAARDAEADSVGAWLLDLALRAARRGKRR